MVFSKSRKGVGRHVSKMAGKNNPEEISLVLEGSISNEREVREAYANMPMISVANQDCLDVLSSSNGENLESCEFSFGSGKLQWFEQTKAGAQVSSNINSSRLKEGLGVEKIRTRSASQSLDLSTNEETLNGMLRYGLALYSPDNSDKLALNMSAAMSSEIKLSPAKKGPGVEKVRTRSASRSLLCTTEETFNGVHRYDLSIYSPDNSDTPALNISATSVRVKRNRDLARLLSPGSSLKRSRSSSRIQKIRKQIEPSVIANELMVSGFSCQEPVDVLSKASVYPEGQKKGVQTPCKPFQDFHSSRKKHNEYAFDLRNMSTPKDFSSRKLENSGAITVSVLQTVPEEAQSFESVDAQCSTTPSNYQYTTHRRSPYILRSGTFKRATDDQCVNSEPPSCTKGVEYSHVRKQKIRKNEAKALSFAFGQRAMEDFADVSQTIADMVEARTWMGAAYAICNSQQWEQTSIYLNELSRLDAWTDGIPTDGESQGKVPSISKVNPRRSGRREQKLDDKAPDSMRENSVCNKLIVDGSLAQLDHTSELDGSIMWPVNKASECNIWQRSSSQDSVVLTTKASAKKSKLKLGGSKQKQKRACKDAGAFPDSAQKKLLLKFEEQQVCENPVLRKRECFDCKGPLSSKEMVICIHKGCQNQYHRPCATQLGGSIWNRNGRFVCPQHVCIACNNHQKGRLWRCQRCSTAVHLYCSPWPDDMIFLDDKQGWAICWKHDLNWKQENQRRRPTSNIQEVFRRLPLPYAPDEFRISSGLRKEVMENDLEPPPYAPIRRNVFLIRKRRDDFDDGAGCTCDNNGSGCGDDCECRVQSMSCSKSCKCEKVCANKPFRKEKRLKVVKTELCGWGAEAGEAIKKGDFVIEYVGEVINDAMCEKRLWAMKGRSIRNFYMCEIGKNFIIDATFKGNPSRYLNHSCEPNCKLEKWRVDGETRVGIFALKDIGVGEPLTYDYKYIEFGANEKCHCGASRCRGALGEKFSNKTKLSEGVGAWGEKQRRTSGLQKDVNLRH